ncbi:MAG: hypothetical protein PHQ76_03535 [Caldisericia bacterium]|nr:hypothetical protein [Caldisericia bacterium]
MSKFKWIITIIIAVVIVIGLNFYLNGKICWIREASAVNIVRRVVPGGPASELCQDGNYIAAIGQVSEENSNWIVYLYDTKGTYDNFNDDTYTTFGETSNGELRDVTIKNDWVTWVDTTAYNSCTSSSFVFKGYQVSTNALFTIDERMGDLGYSRYGNLIAYTAYDDTGDRDIYLFDLENGTKRCICSNEEDQLMPYICGNVIVWSDGRNFETPYRDIYMYNLQTEIETRITTTQGMETWPITNGEWIVYLWASSNNAGKAIKKYNISTGVESIIASNSEVEYTFLIRDINSSFLAWSEDSSEKLYIHNLNSNENTLIENSPNSIWSAELNQSAQPQLVYHLPSETDDFSWGDVYGYDLTTKAKYPIRTAGKTWCEVSLNKTTNTVVMTSFGVNSLNPSECDVSLAFIP